ncbi:DUF6283 family protein [Nocardia sp. NBC_00565]|uniref:DUF6283 family protein n=1 Tax=Nocardia sp. NBC_00565 TaxID=2975993 RepID=UPI002E807CCE|nr:DUF6283 family protein [Nocardia sp. NBC_00565]WUC03651.1 DUF6283 family protein [Nocardia sp. NBC_00565]
MKSPAPRPCESCPYRRDVPSGVWAAEEYDKLRDFDDQHGARMTALFYCHQHDADDERSRLCAGWVGCHGHSSIGLRIAVASGRVSRTVFEYESPVPLFASGAEAADHGQADIADPSEDAARLIDKITANRPSVDAGDQR